MSLEPKRLKVVVNSHKSLIIYSPVSSGQQQIRGKTELDGHIESVQGSDWVLFTRYRGFGLPLKATPHEQDRIELDIEEASEYGDITVEEAGRKQEVTR